MIAVVSNERTRNFSRRKVFGNKGSKKKCFLNLQDMRVIWKH